MRDYKIILILFMMGLSLFACNDYPGHKQITGVKLSLKPIWGELQEQEIVLGGDCHLDGINDESGEETDPHTIRKRETALKVVGWAAVAGKDGVIASDIAIALKPNSESTVRLFAPVNRGKRPDVADYFKNPATVDSGFNVAINLTDIPPGQYILELIQHKDRKNYKCQITSIISVEE